MRLATALSAALLFVAICSFSAVAAPIDGHNDMSWLDGFTLVVLGTDDIPSLHQARAAIQAHGGRVAIMSPPSLLLGWIPVDRRAELIGVAGIERIYDTEVLAGEVEASDFQTKAVVNYFNAVKRGDIQREYFEQAARVAAEPPQPLMHDALVAPPLDEEGYLRNLEAQGLDIQRLKDQGLLVSQAPGQTMGNSDSMTGTISVTIFMVESNGTIDENKYTWTQEAMYEYVNQVNTGLAWWTSMADNYYDCWAAFMVHFYPGTDVRCQQGYEPVIHDGTGIPIPVNPPSASTWVSIVMTNFGYTTGTHFDKVTAFNTWQRSTYGTNWAYSAFVPYNPAPISTAFTDGNTAWTWVSGIYGAYYMVALYRAGGWDPSQVFPHETGHIFQACDEYAESNCTCECDGALRTTSNENCTNCGGSTGCMMKANSFVLCPYTPAQVGWLGTGCAPTPLPAPVATNVSPGSDYQGVTRTITVTGSNFVYGASVNMGADVTLNYTNFINSTSFEANITISNTATVGLRNVIVYNRDLKSSTIVNAFEVKLSTKHYASALGGDVFPYITPANAATSLAAAIAAAGASDSVLVLSTTYTNVDLSIRQGVKMYGAWNASFTSRNVASGKTVLSLTGNIEVGPSAPGQTVIDGFEIYGGTGTAQVTPHMGRYGGAIWASSSPLVVSNCLIRNSQAHDGSFGGGGGIYASGSTVGISGNEIRACTAAQGGAMYLDTCTGTIANNSIHDNSLLYADAAQPANGGGLCVMSSSALALSGNTISANVADPALSTSMNGGGVFVKSTSGFSMNGDIVSNNSSGMSGYLGFGGGIHIEGSGVTMTSVRIEGNQTKTIGGGLYGDATSSVAMNGGTVLANSAVFGGGVYVTGPSSQFNHILWTGNTGTACTISGPTSGSFVGNTMNQNSGSSGAGLYMNGASITVRNNVIANSTGSGIKCTGVPVPTPTYCDLWNNTTNYEGCTAGTGCISLNPLFVNAGGGDLHLAIHSPCIDAGDPNPAYNDPDGSRGDMGVWGSHAFVMDQPVYPKNLATTVVSGHTIVKWKKNTEPDLASYAVYESAVSGFIPSTANFLALVTAPDTTYDDGPAVVGKFYKVNAIDATGYAGGYAGPVESTVTGIGEEVARYTFRLDQNHPNPFNPTTLIRYEVGSRVRVTLGVYDVRGQLVKQIVDEVSDPGTFTKEWDGTNAKGEQVSTGVYFYRLNAGSFNQTRKMVLLK